MGTIRNINFANFICRFGEKAVMLDYAEEIVLPAFESNGKRMYGESSYFFQNVSLQNYGNDDNPELVIVGRLIQDTILSREQKYEDGKLVKDRASMPSAPSALFALVMESHKLLYFPETKSAPSLQAFRATAARLIRDVHMAHINTQHEKSVSEGKRISKKKLMEALPVPTIEVVPLSSPGSLEEFVKQFKVLQQIRIELVDPNDEVDGRQLVQAMRETKDSLGATSTAITYGNSNGLSQNKAVGELETVVAEGNTKVTLVGKDAVGDTLRGNNDSFKLGMPIEDVSSNPVEAGKDFYSVFKEKVSDGLLKVQAIGDNVRQKIKKISKNKKQ